MESQLADENKGHDVDKSDISSPNERLYSRDSLSSSSEQSSDFEEPSQGEKSEAAVLITRGAVSKDEELDQMSQQPGGESTLQSPPSQTTERPPDSSESRIPSYVFARNKSGNPGDWSITSNESLFSIQMGTTSFTHDQFSWLMKSGELNGEGYKNLDPHHPTSEDLHASGDEISPVVPAESPSEPTNTEKSTDISTAEIASTSTEVAAVNVEGDPGAESAAGDRKREPEVEIDHNSNTKSSPIEKQTRHSARGSDASGQSFAFPLLVGDVDGGGSVKSGRAPQEKSQGGTQTQPPQETSSLNADQVHAETGEAAQSPSWISRCISFCSCR